MRELHTRRGPGRGWFAWVALVIVAGVARGQVSVPDPGFRVVVTRSGEVPVYAAADRQGRVLVQGEFEVVNGVRCAGAARVETNGALDAGFRFDAKARPVPEPDGGTLLWYETSVKRMRADGTLDPGFEIQTREGEGGASGRRIRAVVVEGNGRIWVAGDFTMVNGVRRSLVARLDTTGRVDPNFVPELGLEETAVETIAVQPDGRLLAARAVGSYSQASVPPLVRLRGDGSRDPTFQMEPGDMPLVRALAVRTNGNILVAGVFARLAGLERSGLVELRADGSPDPAANTGSGANGPNGPAVDAVLPSPDGGSWAGGYFIGFNGIPRLSLVRLLADGSVDPNFNARLVYRPGRPRITALLPTGSGIVVGGALESAFGKSRFNLLRLTWAGDLDPEFVPDIGVLSGASTAVGPDGRILVAGNFNRVNGTDAVGLAMLLPDGQVDPSFHASIDPRTALERFQIVFPAAGSGSFWIGGGFTNVNGAARLRVAKLNSDGSLAANTRVPSWPGSAPVTALAEDSQGRLLVGAGGRVFRYATDGSSDTTFAAVTHTGGVVGLIPQPGSEVLVIRDKVFPVTNQVVRLDPAGKVETSYRGGTNFLEGSMVAAAAAQPDGRVLVGGGFFLAGGDRSSSNKIVRLLPGGALDRSFAPDPLAGMPVVEFIQVEPGGRIVVGCRSSRAGRTLARLNPDGSLDPTFDLASRAGLAVSGLAVEPGGGGLLVAGIAPVTDALPLSTLCRWTSLPNAVLSLRAPDDAWGPRLRVRGLPGHRHRIEYSDDLLGWRSLGVMAADCMPPCEIELDALAAEHRFYRAIQVP